MLVEGFMAAKSLQASVGNIVGQLKGSGGGRGGKGIGLFGIFAAIAIAVGALLVPKIKEAVKFLINKQIIYLSLSKELYEQSIKVFRSL